MYNETIEGVPTGWKLVRIETAYPGEYFLAADGRPLQAIVPGAENKNYVILRPERPMVKRVLVVEYEAAVDQIQKTLKDGKFFGATPSKCHIEERPANHV